MAGSSENLLEIARSVVDAELAVEDVLANVVRAACQLTGAQYGALGVLDDSGTKVWLRRDLRRRGLLTAAWPLWIDRYGTFKITRPNEAMSEASSALGYPPSGAVGV